MSERVDPPEVPRWLRYAREDLGTAELILEHGQVPRAACFHAQQCAEKALKGALVYLQIPFSKTHDLFTLRRLLSDEFEIGVSDEDLIRLSRWAVEPRYPGDFVEASRQDAALAVRRARDVYETTFEDLKRHGYEPEEDV
jgi:HEPN domain-containing protein